MVEYLYDRMFHGVMQIAWAEGFPARCPTEADPCEWRESARRLARHLGCHVRTGLRPHGVVAVANDGFPLGIVDPYERDAWLRQRAEASV